MGWPRGCDRDVCCDDRNLASCRLVRQRSKAWLLMVLLCLFGCRPSDGSAAVTSLQTGRVVHMSESAVVLESCDGEVTATFDMGPSAWSSIGREHLQEHLERGWPIKLLFASDRVVARISDAECPVEP